MLEIIITIIFAAIVAYVAKGFLTNPGSDVPSYTEKKPKQQGGGAAGVGAGASKKKEEDNNTPLILYGTQTGTAEMFSKTLVREGHQYEMNFRCADLEDYDCEKLADEKLVIFIVATYGEGEPTDSAKSFHEHIFDSMRMEGSEYSNVKYCVFGLGDRQYPKYCQMAIDVDEQMDKLGGQRIYGMGTGDAGRSLEEEWDTWRVDLWAAIAAALGVPLKERGSEPIKPELKMMELPEAKPAKTPFLPIPAGLEPTQRQPSVAKIDSNDELLKNCPDRSTRHVVLDISNSAVTYQAGDHLGILSFNPDSVVEEALKVLHISQETANLTFALVDNRNKNTLPAKVAVKTALKWYVDLCGVPKKSALRAFTHYCTNEQEKQEFQDLLQMTPEAKAAYNAELKTCRTALGFLRRFPSCKVPLGHFFELMPRIAPRYFSISSDSLKYPQQIFITVALVDGGLCTQMLGKSKPGDEVYIFVRKSTFHLPMRAKTRPLIMIGPGTGVAPLVGFCHRRAEWRKRKQDIGPCMFFFGCRKKNEDYLYRDFLEECHENGVITDLVVAFSREQAEKRYVQHELADRGAKVWELLKQGANLYICGDAKHMAKDVEKTLLQIIEKEGGKNGGEAEEFLNKMLTSEKYLKDVWSA